MEIKRNVFEKEYKKFILKIKMKMKLKMKWKFRKL